MADENPYLALVGGAAAPTNENPYLALVESPTSQPAEDEDKPRALADIGRGVVTAPVSFVQGLVELGAIGVDAAFGTNATRNVTDFFESVKEDIRPETGVGKTAEELLVFGAGFVPIAGWLNRASAVARGRNVGNATSAFMRSAENFGRGAGKNILQSRAGLVGSTALGAGIYETIVSPSGRSTMADNYQFLPDALKTEADEQLTGREEAFRQFRNKLRQGAEASSMSLGFDAALFGLGTGARAVGTLPGVSELSSSAARATTRGFEILGRGLQQVPGGRNATQQFKRFFSPTKGADPRLFEELMDAQAFSDSVTRETARRLNEYNNAATKAVRMLNKAGDTSFDMARAKDDFRQFLLGNRAALEPYGDEVVSAADELIDIRTRLQDRMIGQLEQVVKSAPPGKRLEMAQRALSEIQANQEAEQGYLNRIFEMFERPVDFYKNLDLDLDGPQFDKAVQDVASYLSKGRGDDFRLSPSTQAQAKKAVLEILGLESVMKGTAPKEALRNKVTKVTDELLGGGTGPVAKETPLLKLSTDMFIERKDMISESPHLRALMGEIKDPDELLVTTMNKLAKTAAASQFYRSAAGSGLTTPLASALDQIRAGGRPLFVEVPDQQLMSFEQYDLAMAPFERESALLQQLSAEGAPPISSGKPQVETFTKVLEDSGYVRLGESTADNVFGGQYGALSGMYVPKETFRAISAPLQLNTGFLSEAAAILNQVRGMAQKQMIVPNPASRVRDFLGSTAMLVGNANLPRDMDLGTAIKVFVGDLSQLDEAGLQRLKTKIELSGTQDSNLLLSAVREYLQEGENLSVAGKFQDFRKRAAESRGLMPLTKINGFFERLTEGTDSFFKGLAVMSEEAKITEALRAAGLEQFDADILSDFMGQGLAKRTSSDILSSMRPDVRLSPAEIIAADIVKDTMPIYNRVGAAVRALDRVPLFGNFTSFASENIRNSVNILDRGLRELGYKMSDDLASRLDPRQVQKFERQIRALGAQRLAGYLTVASIAPKAMVRGSMQATGTTDEDMERLYQLLPDYLDGHDIVVLSNDGEGNIEYIDLSYVAPYGYITDSIQAALREYGQRGVLGKAEAEQIAAGAFNGLSALAEPFLAESIVFERIRDVLPSGDIGSIGVGRGGVTPTGAKVYNETDPLGDKVSQGFLHVVDSLLPAYTKLAAETTKGEILPGRLTRAMTETPGARGNDYDAYEELARQVTGFTPMELNLRRDFEFSGKAYAPRRSEAKTAANRVIRAADSTPEDMVRGWENYLDALYREQSRLYNDIQAARQLGLSDREIRQNLIEKANLGTDEVNTIMRGQFAPGTVSREVLQEVRMQMSREGRDRLTRTVPVADLNALSRERRRQPLSPDIYRDQGEPTAIQPAAAPDNPYISLVAESAPVAPAPAGPTPSPAAPAAPAPAARQAPPAELLGGNLMDRLRNSEIVQRLQGE